MSIYQRYLSKSLIFFSVFFIILLIFIESNMGFKWIVNFAGRFLMDFKTEEVSGNWHNFTLKNIKYNDLGLSIQAKSVHVILDTSSLFKKSIIFKNIETKELIISLNKNISTDIFKSNTLNISIKKNIYFK